MRAAGKSRIWLSERPQLCPFVSLSWQKRHKADNTVNKKKTTGIVCMSPALFHTRVYSWGFLFFFHGWVNSRCLSLSTRTIVQPPWILHERGCTVAAPLTSAPSSSFSAAERSLADDHLETGTAEINSDDYFISWLKYLELCFKVCWALLPWKRYSSSSSSCFRPRWQLSLIRPVFHITKLY